MSRPHRRATAVLLALALLAACGNSGGDEATDTTAPDSTAGVPGNASTSVPIDDSERDTFVPITGVPGVTDDAITYDVVGTKTGNLLGTCILDCYVQGIQAYFDWRNDQGGIYGRELRIGKVLDDELGMNQVKSLEVASSDDTFGSFNATLLATGWGDLDSAGVPTYTWGIDAKSAADRPHIFPSLVARCPDCPRPSVPYIAGQVGATKAATLGYSVDESSKVCAATLADAFEKYQADTGVEVVYTNDDLEYGLPNGIGPEVTAMKQAGVDFIAGCIDLNGMKSLANELHRQDMDDVILQHPNTYDQAFVAEAGDLFEGDVVNVQFRPFEADSEGTAAADFQAAMEAADIVPSELTMVGWINASLAFDGLLAAGPEFDRESVTAATNALNGYSAGGVLEPVNWAKAHTPYTADDPDPDDQDCFAAVRVQDGAFVPFGEADTPWTCFPGDDITKPTPTDFT